MFNETFETEVSGVDSQTWDLEPPRLTPEAFETTVENVFKWTSSKSQRKRLVRAVEYISLIIRLDHNEGLNFLARDDVCPGFLIFIAKITAAYIEFKPRPKYHQLLTEAATVLSAQIVYFLQYLLDINKKEKFSEMMNYLATFYYHYYVLDPEKGNVPYISDTLCADPWNFIFEGAYKSPKALIAQLAAQDPAAPTVAKQATSRKRILREDLETEPLQAFGNTIKEMGLDIYDMRIYSEDTLALDPKHNPN